MCGTHGSVGRVSQSSICLDRTVLGNCCTQQMGHNIPRNMTSHPSRQLHCNNIAYSNYVSIANSRKVGCVLAWRIDGDCSPWSRGFECRTVYMGFVVDEVGQGGVFVTVIRGLHVGLISPMLYIN
jgi:hypothetical protein